MPPTAARLARIAAILAGLLVVLALALPYVVSLDAMRARAAAAAGAALHRKVEIGRMRLEILSGLGAGVEKVAVRNQAGFETPALVSADRVSVKVAFWPLFSRRVEVRKLVLDGVTVAIERDPNGALNIGDFLSAGRRDSPPASATAAAALLVSSIEIDRGRAVFVDRKAAPGRTITLVLEDLTGRITDIGPSTPARFALAARFLADSGRNLTLTGMLGPPPPQGPVGQAPFEAAIDAKSLALARLAPYVAAFGAADPGTLSLSGKAAGRLLSAFELSGSVALDPAGPASPLPSVEGTYVANLDWVQGTLVVGRSLFDVAALPLAVEGRLDDLREDPRVDLRIATPGEVPIDDVTGLPGIAGRLPESVKLSGRVRLDARIQGRSSDLETLGTMDAAPFAVRVDGQPFLEAPAAHATLGSRGKSPLAGKVAIASGKLKTLPFENLSADWTWNEGTLAFSPSAGVFGGMLSARVEADLGKAQSESRVELDIAGVQAQALIDAVTSVRGVFAGTLKGKMSLSSRGLAWDAISKTARGEGRLSVADADLKTVQLLPEVARSLSAVGKVAGFQIPESLESTRFSTLETSLQLSDGRLSTPDLILSSRNVSVSADGSLGLDKTLSYQGRVVLGPSIVRSLGKAGRYIADPQGRLALPFTVSGQVTTPKVAIDEAVVLDLGRRVLARQAQERIGGTAGKILGDALEGGDGAKASPIDLLQQLLKSPPPTPAPH